MGKFFTKSGTYGKLAHNGQILYDNCWAIRLIAALLLTFMLGEVRLNFA